MRIPHWVKNFWQWLIKYTPYVKMFLISLLAVIAFFVTKDAPWTHWSWITYFVLASVLLCLEGYGIRQRNLSPEDKIKNYLLDAEGWEATDSDNYVNYYKSAPEFTLQTDDGETRSDCTQEWTRGEIGLLLGHANNAYYRDIYVHGTILKRIHIVNFDDNKKTVVAPDWEAVGKGRIYFYLKDSIKYAYQRYLIAERKEDYSRNLRRIGDSKGFDIPVFENSSELELFKKFCKTEASDVPERDAGQQNALFYALIEKYQDFRKQNKYR